MLLERDDELSVLRALAGAAAQDSAGLLVIEGPAGIGKTRLVAEARRQAIAAGVRVCGARGGELEQELAFGAVRQLFEGAITDASLLDGGAAAAREVFDGPAHGVGGEDASFAILHALYRLTVNLAEREPVLLAVDDLQWCDEPSLRWLCYLVRRLDGLRVTVLCGVRPFERHRHGHLIGEIARDPLAITLQPKPLSERASGTLLGDEADEVFARAGHAATGGTPLLLVELAKALRAEGVTPDAAHVSDLEAIAPRAVSRAVLVRIGRLSANAAAVARATAVLGEAAGLPLVAELAALDERAAVAAGDELVAAEVFGDTTTLAFVHPLIRAAVYEDIPAHERSLEHEQAGRLLQARGAGAGPVAAQVLHAPERGETWVVDVLEQAALAAQRAGAPASAVTYLTRALAEPPPSDRRVAVLVALGSAENLRHSKAGSVHLREAHALAADPIVRATVALQLAHGLAVNLRADEAVALGRRAAAELPPEADVLLAAFEALELTAPLFGGSEPVAPERVAAYRRLPLAPGVGPKMLAAIAAYGWAFEGGSADACARVALAALDGWELIRGGHQIPSITATMVLELGDRPEADEAWAEFAAYVHASGSMWFNSALRSCRGYSLLRRGELDDAEASLREAIEVNTLGAHTGDGGQESVCFLAAVQRERGDLAAARRELERARDPGDASQGARFWLHGQAELLLAEERFEEALTVARDATERFGPMVTIDTPFRSVQALALHHLGRTDEALAAAAEELETARRWGAPSLVARALRVLGTIESNPERLREAVERAEHSPARLEQGQALLALGVALRAGRRPAEARAPLRQALEIADARGANGLAGRARSELYAAGGRPRTTALQGRHALTPSELRIAERAAAGQTNRAIAEALFVTPKTVELHLRNAYRKLGAHTRSDLAGTLT